MSIGLLDERVGQPLLHGFRPVEGNPERRATSTALLTHIQRQHAPGMRGYFEVPKISREASGGPFISSRASISGCTVAVKHAPLYFAPGTGRFAGYTVSDDLQAELERLRAENERLKKSSRSKLAMKVSEKGALSVYGMGRFPVTLYKEQWLKLLGMGEEIKAFIEANNESLKSKE
jgi:hypothetical protein